MQETNTGGRPAACATETEPRCLNFDTCTSCIAWKKRDDKRKTLIARAVKRAESERVETPLPVPDPEPLPPTKDSGVPKPSGSHRDSQESARASAPMHATLPDDKLPKVSVLIPAPLSFKGWGPSDPEPEQTPEEEERASAEDSRAEQMENPSAMAVLAAGYYIEFIEHCIGMMATLGSPIPPALQQVSGLLLGGLKKSAEQSFSLILPDKEPPWYTCHILTGGAGAAAVGGVYFAKQKAMKAAKGSPGTESTAGDDPEAQEGDPGRTGHRPEVDDTDAVIELVEGDDGVMEATT